MTDSIGVNLREIFLGVVMDGNEWDGPRAREEMARRGHPVTSGQAGKFFSDARFDGLLVKVAFGVYRAKGATGPVADAIPRGEVQHDALARLVLVVPPPSPDLTDAVASLVASLMGDGHEHTVDDLVVRARERGTEVHRLAVTAALVQGCRCGAYATTTPGRVRAARRGSAEEKKNEVRSFPIAKLGNAR